MTPYAHATDGTKRGMIDARRQGLAATLKGLWPISAILIGLALFYFLGGERLLGIDTLRENRAALAEWVETNGLWALAAFGLAYAAMVALSVPGGAIMSLAGGFLFGVIVGTAVIVVAATIGATLLFLAARTSLAAPLRSRAGPWLRRIEEGFHENAFSYLLVLRLVPVFPFWLVNLAPAFLHIPLPTYVLGTFIGIIPATLVYVWAGSGLGLVLDRGEEPDLGLILTPDFLGPLLALALMATAPIVYKRLKQRRASANG